MSTQGSQVALAVELRGLKRAARPKPTPRCPHVVRTKDGGTKAINATRGQAIKLFCMECLGWDTHPKDCTARLCPLFPYRGRTQASMKGDADA